MIEIGIDEAGYGPLLGPLVVTAWGIGSKGREPGDLWGALETVVARRKTSDRMVVADSKVVYSTKTGLKRLEQSVLAFLHASGIHTATYAELLKQVVNDEVLELPTMWCEPENITVPVDAQVDEVHAASGALTAALRKEGLNIEYVSSRVVSPRLFNEGIAYTDNKSVTLFSHTSSLIKHASATLGKRLTRVTADNIGSMKHYRRMFSLFFMGWKIKTEYERKDSSAYQMETPDGHCFELVFLKKGDSKNFLVALSSMQSKYLRELQMRAFNAFWKRHIPNLPPTAGYPADAGRFIAAILPHARSMGLAESDFIRSR